MAAVPRRAEYHDYILDVQGRPIPGTTVNVYQVGTTTAITETIYADATGATSLTNPLTTDSLGYIQFYLDRPKIVDLAVSKTGYTSFTLEDAAVRRAGTMAAAFTVASNDATDAAKATADYVCDGVADDEEINAAIAALGSFGGTVELSEGDFNITATIVLEHATNLIGQGINSTNIVVTVGSAIDIISSNGQAITYPRVADMYLFGRTASASGKGINMNGWTDGIVEDVEVHNTKDSGIYADATVLATGVNTLRNVLVAGTFRYGFELTQVFGWNLDMINAYQCYSGGYFDGCGEMWLTSPEFASSIGGINDGRGAHFASCLRMKIIKPWLDDNYGMGLRIDGTSTECEVDGGHLRGNALTSDTEQGLVIGSVIKVHGMHISDEAASTNGLYLYAATNSEFYGNSFNVANVGFYGEAATINCEIHHNDLTNTGTTFQGVDLTRNTVRDNRPVGVCLSSAPAPEGMATTLFDDFDKYQTWIEAETPWILNKGSDGACADPVIVNDKGGIVRLVTAAAAPMTVATDGSQIIGAKPWSVDMGSLVFEARLRIATATTGVQICVGLTDVTTLEMPATISGTTITTNFSNGCVFVYDTTQTTDQWYAVGVAGDTDATGNAITGTAPTAAVYQRLRIEIDSLNVARFYIDGVLKVSLTANACTAATSIYPTVVVTGDSTAKTVDVDYISVSATRVA